MSGRRGVLAILTTGSVGEPFAAAVRAHQAGRVEEASYEQILRQRPDHAGSWNLLGLVYRERGDLARAASHISRAIPLDATKAVDQGPIVAWLSEPSWRSQFGTLAQIGRLWRANLRSRAVDHNN